MWKKIKRFFRKRVMAKNGEVAIPLLTDDQADSSTPPDVLSPGYATVRVIVTVVVRLAMRFWGFLATFFLMLLLTWWMYGGIWAFILLVLAIMGVGYNVQDMLLYYPNQPSTSRFYVESPASLNIPFENIFIRTKDGLKINALFLKQRPPFMSTAVTVIYFHGNAGNIGHRLLNAQGFYATLKCNILLVEYRGYGKSEGKPSEGGLYIDAISAFEYLMNRNDVDHSKIVLFGRSLGGAIATQLASQVQCSKHALCLILENTFTSLPDIGRYIFDIRPIHYIPDWAHKNKYPTKRRVQRITLPTLFMSGLADTLIPPTMMQQLYDISGSSMKRMARFDAGTHNETWMCHGYYETMNRFIEEVLQTRLSNMSKSPAGAYSTNVPFDDGGAFHL